MQSRRSLFAATSPVTSGAARADPRWWTVCAAQLSARHVPVTNIKGAAFMMRKFNSRIFLMIFKAARMFWRFARCYDTAQPAAQSQPPKMEAPQRSAA